MIKTLTRTTTPKKAYRKRVYNFRTLKEEYSVVQKAYRIARGAYRTERDTNCTNVIIFT